MSLALSSPTSEQHVARTRPARAARVDVAIVCSVAAAFAHLVAAPGHYLWWPASGLFFVALGVAQLVVAVVLMYSVDNRIAPTVRQRVECWSYQPPASGPTVTSAPP